MSNVISNQNKLTALEFQFVSLKQKLKNDGILVENNKEYRRLQKAVSRCKKAIQVEETYFSENNVEKIPSPSNVVGVPKNLSKKQKISSPINVTGEENSKPQINSPEVTTEEAISNKKKLSLPLKKKNKNSSPTNVVGLPKKFQKKYPQKTLKISSPINVVEFPKENKNINLGKKFSPINVVGPSKEILAIDLPITEKNLIDVINKENLLILRKNLTNVIKIDDLLEVNKSIPAVRKVFTLGEKELLLKAKKSVAEGRAYMQNRSLTEPERFAVWKTVDEPPTAYDENLLALWKLYPVVFSRFPEEGKKPQQVFVFGEDEATFRILKKYKLLFPKRWPKSHETVSIDRESELEREESELVFLKGLLENKSDMRKNTAIVEKISFLTLRIFKNKEFLASHPVPTKPS